MPAKLMDGNNTVPWEDYERGNIKHTQPIQMKKDKWAMVYSDYDF
jgi:hypothetical protein